MLEAAGEDDLLIYGMPSNKILQVAGFWGVAGCSPGQAASDVALGHIWPTTSVLSADNPTLFLAPASRTLNMMCGDIVALPVRCQDKSATSLTSLASAVPGCVALACRSHTHSPTHPHDFATLPKNRQSQSQSQNQCQSLPARRQPLDGASK